MSNISFNTQVLEAESILANGVNIDSSGVVSFNPDSVGDAQSIFADLTAWTNVENGRNCLVAASAKVLVDNSQQFFENHPEVSVLSMNLPLGNDIVDHRINRDFQITSSYIARGASPEAEELQKVHEYAKVLFSDSE